MPPARGTMDPSPLRISSPATSSRGWARAVESSHVPVFLAALTRQPLTGPFAGRRVERLAAGDWSTTVVTDGSLARASVSAEAISVAESLTSTAGRPDGEA